MAAGQPYHHRGDPTSPYNRSSFRSSTPARNGRDPDPPDTASAHPLPRRRPLLRPNPASSPIPTPANTRRRCSGHRTTSRIRISAPPPVPRRRRLEDAGTPPRRRTRRRIHAVAASRCPDVRPEISRSSDPRYPLLRHQPQRQGRPRAAASAPVHHPIGLLVELNGKGGGISTSYYTKTNFPIEGTPYVSRQLEGQSDSLSDPRPRLGGPRLGHLFLVASEMDPNEVYSIQGFGADAKLMYEARQVANDAVSSIRTVASFSAEEKVRKC